MMKEKKYNPDLFGDNLREIRSKKGITIEEFAYLLGVSDRMVKYYESGRYYPKLDKFVQICRILDVSYNSILPV